MPGRLDELIEQWDRDRGDTPLSAIVEAARVVALKAAHASGARGEDLDDAAQHACHKLTERYLRGGQPIASPTSLVWRIATNFVRDVQRKRARQRTLADAYGRDPTLTGAEAVGADVAWMEAERQDRVRQLVRAALAQAPETYRRVIQLHFLEEVSIEEIAETYFEEMRESFDPGDDAAVHAARKRARNRVDQHLTRAKRWLQQRLAGSLRELEP